MDTNLVQKYNIYLYDGKPYGLVMAQHVRPREYDMSFGCLSPLAGAVLVGGLGLFGGPTVAAFGALFGAIIGNGASSIVSDMVMQSVVRKQEETYFGSIEKYLIQVEEFIQKKTMQPIPNYLQDAIRIDALPFYVKENELSAVEQIILSIRNEGYSIYPATNTYRNYAYLQVATCILSEDGNIINHPFLSIFNSNTTKDADKHLVSVAAKKLVGRASSTLNQLEIKALKNILDVE
ncbi:MAG: hypothetical protein ABIJ34_08780 [archaeon]